MEVNTSNFHFSFALNYLREISGKAYQIYIAEQFLKKSTHFDTYHKWITWEKTSL